MTTNLPARGIRLIALDLDGTLLNSNHDITPRTEQAIKAAIAQGVMVVIATGKTFHSARTLIERLGLTTPGVFVQGLALHNADGSVRSRVSIDPQVALRAAEYAEQHDIPAGLYSDLRILCREPHPLLDILQRHHEPDAEFIGSLREAARTLPVQKIIYFGTPEAMAAARQDLAARFNGSATLVEPLAGMLEVLPRGASKGSGLKRLIDELGIDAGHVMAVGDGENDLEMLRMAGIGVAMGNAMPAVIAAADVVVADHDQDGVAEAIERFVLMADTE